MTCVDSVHVLRTGEGYYVFSTICGSEINVNVRGIEKASGDCVGILLHAHGRYTNGKLVDLNEKKKLFMYRNIYVYISVELLNLQ